MNKAIFKFKAMNILNVTNNTSSQIFYFTNPYEAKYAIGVNESKKKEFESKEGISYIESLYNNKTSGLPPDYYGRFRICGESNAVDKVMLEIKDWLHTCQENQYNIY